MARGVCPLTVERSSSSDLSSTSNWAGLADDLVGLILNKLIGLGLGLGDDYIRFSAVCKSWNSMALKHRELQIQLSKTHRPPWLMIHCPHNSVKRISLYNFLTATEISNLGKPTSDEHRRIEGDRSRSDIRNSCGESNCCGSSCVYMTCCSSVRRCRGYKRFCGSSHGWFFFTEKKLELVLLNPISGKIIRLPPLEQRGRRYNIDVGKAILSNDPNLGSFEVLAMYNNSNVVAHLKFGDKFWTYSDFYMFSSVTFYNDIILGASTLGAMMSLNVTRSCPVGKIKITKIAPELQVEDMSSMELDHEEDKDSSDSIDELDDEEGMYYSDSSEESVFEHCVWDSFFTEITNGDLLMVHRHRIPTQHRKDESCPTYKIFKIIVSKQGQVVERIPVVDLNGHSLFLDRNHCFSVLASKYPGCAPNFIYYAFADKYSINSKYEIEGFNLKDQSVQCMHTKFDKLFPYINGVCDQSSALWYIANNLGEERMFWVLPLI